MERGKGRVVGGGGGETRESPETRKTREAREPAAVGGAWGASGVQAPSASNRERMETSETRKLRHPRPDKDQARRKTGGTDTPRFSAAAVNSAQVPAPSGMPSRVRSASVRRSGSPATNTSV